MDQAYLFMVIALLGLATVSLTVGVTNDATNFLNSAVGSKAVSFRTILIVASIGIAVGALFSGGMMEVARKGIFNPGYFYFNEIIIIFMAVMVTDVLLLDLFNSLGLPTSTTVSLVFELLGAAVCIALLKLYHSPQEGLTLLSYINTEKATEIIFGIILSVVIAFTVGVIVQYISRLLFSFHFERPTKYLGGIFGGAAITVLFYFILIEGLEDVAFIPAPLLAWIDSNTFLLLAGLGLFFTIISQLIISVFKWNIFKIIILTGTFALAMAFAGNDLVNFIGAPLAAWQSFQLWSQSSLPADAYTMEQLAGAVKTPYALLFTAGFIMVITLWFSRKARTVIETSVNLSRQQEGTEKFRPHFFSRLVVRAFSNLGGAFSLLIPQRIQQKIDGRFVKPLSKKVKDTNAPAFDMVRASVNLVVASILISMGTSLKLPLSTTYVTFMVAMGTSLADRAWDRESAVYRVAGVFNVVGGWFITALVAFLAAAFFALCIYYGGVVAVSVLLVITFLLLVRSFMMHRRAEKERKEKRKLDRTTLITMHEMVQESSTAISVGIRHISELYGDVVHGLGLQDLAKLKKCRKSLKKLEDEVEDLKADIFYFIKSLDESSVNASRFYILILDYLQDMVQSIGYIVKNSYEHVNNHHKKLKFNQLKDLKGIDEKLHRIFGKIKKDFDAKSFTNIPAILAEERELIDHVAGLIQKQIIHIRETETSPKNTKLYFGLLLETRDLITATVNLLELFEEFQKNYTGIKK